MSGMVSLTMGNPPLPFAHGGVGDEETLGKFLLGHPQLFPALEKEGPETFSVFHKCCTPFLGCALQDGSMVASRGGIVKVFGQIRDSTVRKVLVPQGFPLPLVTPPRLC